jgi:hypothetical protein
MQVFIKAKLPENKPDFLVWIIELKVNSLYDLEKSIEYNWWKIILNVLNSDDGHYLKINDYYKWKKKDK